MELNPTTGIPVTRTAVVDPRVSARPDTDPWMQWRGIGAGTKPAEVKAPEVKPGTMVGATEGVRFERHASGVQQMKFYDKRTGEEIQTFPSERVLDAVTDLVDALRRKV